MKEYTSDFPSISALGSALGSFLDKTLHGLERTLAKYSEALSGVREKLSVTTVFPQILPQTFFSVESGLIAQLFETLAVLNDKEFMNAIKIGRADLKEGRTHNFSELLSEYGIE